MKKVLGSILVIFIFNIESAVVSNAPHGGYLGDQFINYIKAKYLAKKYNIPFELRTFQYAEKFILDDLEPKVHTDGINIDVQNELQIAWDISNAFYNVSYYCNIDGWRDAFDTYTWHSAFDDEIFIKEIKKLIALKNDIKIDYFPDAIMVAVHVRRPSNTDDNHLGSGQFYSLSTLHRKQHNRVQMDRIFPFKFPPHQFYIDQIKRFAKMFPDKNIRIYIFTDYINPQEICDLYSQMIQNEKITFCCKNEHYKSCVAEDLIALSKFDYLIRSKSNFSQVADFIGNHKIVISPDNLVWYKNSIGQDCLVAETVIIKRRNDDGLCVQEIVNNL